MARRACDSPPRANGGDYCSGRSVMYKSCNFQPCDPKAADFREEQCAEFNGLTKGIAGLTSDVKWVPKYGMDHPDDICKLYCRVEHSKAFYMLKEKVIDGTKCGLNTFDICVNGLCKPGGCDNRLDSDVNLDECGVCGGDNSKCEVITGHYNLSSYGYNRVARLPKGSSNIYIQQGSYVNTSADANYLALVDGETGLYILNGNLVVSSFPKDVIFGGMTITYSGSKQVIEHITTPKYRKLANDLVLEVLSVGRLLPPDITYRYTIDKDQAPRYGWRLYDHQWTKCSSECSGKRYLRPFCTDLGTSKHVQDSHCSDLEIYNLMQQKDCNTHCRYAWNVLSRGQCSSQCGKGLRPIVYSCVKIYLNEEQSTTRNYPAMVNDKHCSNSAKPAETEPCQGSCDSTRWEYDEWSKCTKTCGGGNQRRRTKCIDKNDNVISDSQCNDNERVAEQTCNNQKCPVWSVDDWTPCSVSCGKGYRTRPYYCHLDGHSYSTDACDPSELPALKEECNEGPCVVWSLGKWSDCNVTCGEGSQERDVFCRHTLDSSIVDEEYCSDMLKPNSSRSCFRDKCEVLAPYQTEYGITSGDLEDNNIIPLKKYDWVTSAWTECTKSCQTGTKSRRVVCRNKYGDENEHSCDRRQRPVDSVECHNHPCPSWNFGAWSSCDSNCEQHRQVSCQNASGVIVEDEQCNINAKPYRSTKCNTERCIKAVSRHPNAIGSDYYGKQYRWKTGSWSPCSESCGTGVRTRSVRCDVDNITVVDQYCKSSKKPTTTKMCKRNECDYVWVESPWSQCSQTCGKGYKHRNVSCHKVMHGGYVDPNPLPEFSHNMIHHSYCNIYNRPSFRTSCFDRNCNDLYSWSVGSWGQCSHSCGKKGRQARPLYCIDRYGKKVKRRLCPKFLKPKKKRKCNRKRCWFRSCKEIKHAKLTTNNKDYYILVDEKPANIYCYKMDTQEPEEFISLKPDRQNFAEVYDKVLHERNSCPSSGQRRDDCDCMSLDSDRSGTTVFWKVRLNITSLQIVADDYTFSRQIKGKVIPFGTAGDCYSEQEGCIQGMFSIDLTDTSFRLSRNVRWIHNGNKASLKIDVQERMVRGRCGGFCGSCFPDPSIGLAVEVT